MIKRLALALGVAASIGVAQPANAAVIYTYSGPAFTEFVGIYGCPSICSVTGSFTMADALAADSYVAWDPVAPVPFGYTSITPTSYSFTDGVHVFDATTVQRVFAFLIKTDASGLPFFWDLTFQTNTAAAPPMRALGTIWGLGLERDISNQTGILDVQLGGSAACYNCAKGTWTVRTTDPPSVPEPSLLLLLGTGLTALATRFRSTASRQRG